MLHWSERYIGLPYVLGESDCGHMAAGILREVFGKTIPERAAVEREVSRLGRVHQMSDVVESFCLPVDAPEEGDLVLMLCRGRPSHIGVYCRVNGRGCVLHAMENAGMTVLHPIARLSSLLLSVEGYYRWK